MSKSCVYLPKRGKETFIKLKRNFGHDAAATVFNKITGDDFLNMFENSLTLDSEGIPTYQSIIRNPLVEEYLGVNNIAKAFQKDQLVLDNTAQNASILINKAHEFNNGENADKYIAIVDYTEDNKITVTISEKTEETINNAYYQYRIQKLNEKVSELLSSLGITITELSKEQTSLGKVGLTDFNHAQDIASGFAGLMQVANNLEGYTAISEEFAHFIIGVYRQTPLVSRAINLLKDENNARAVLKDQYDTIYENYKGNIDAIAEEAAGHILRDSLLKNNNSPKLSLFERMVNYIVNLFKGLNPGYYKNAINNISEDMGKLAKDILSSKRTVTKQEVLESKRDAKFNALSERAEKQTKVLKQIIERAFKNASLQENIEDIMSGKDSERAKSRKVAEQISSTIKEHLKEEETLLAIASFLDIAKRDIKDLFKDMKSLETMDIQDKFIILRNALYTIQSYAPTLDELYGITTEEYMSDEGIKNQKFVVEDSVNSLEEFESSNTEEPVNTTGMTPEEIVRKIVESSANFELSDDESYYINKKTGEKYMRVTEVISADETVEKFDPNSPWAVPSSNIGTGVDELVRDFIAGRISKEGETYKVDGKELDEVYPNASKEKLNMFVGQLIKFKKDIQSKDITLVPRDITVNGTITTIDDIGTAHEVNVAGTLDLLGYDAYGNWYIYDMKTHRGIIDDYKTSKYEKQLTLYKNFLENKFGIEIKNLNVIPIKVSYPVPTGVKGGTAKYTVDTNIPEGYLGKKGNQLLKESKPFKSANPFLEDVIEITDRETNVDYKKLSGDLTGGLGDGRKAVLEAINSVQRLYKEFISEFENVAMPEFIKYLQPFVGENIEILDPKTNKMKKVALSKVLTESPSDVTFLQKWLTTMADNPNAMLQIFDKVVKIAKDEKRLKVIEKAKEILALGKEYEAKGITSYDKFFEEDKNNYIIHLEIEGKDYSYDRSAYEKAKNIQQEKLDKQYGKHPEIGSKEYKSKKQELKDWIENNTKSIKNGNQTVLIPNPSIYPSTYNNLTAVEKEFYNKWMQIKEELDDLLGPGKTFSTNTIKIRKHGIERLKGVINGDVITEFVESVKSKVTRSFDDETSYEDAKGIRGFNNEEIMKLPLYYIHGKGDTKDISTDMIGTLVAYAEMAYNYDAMRAVMNPLEIGRHITLSNSMKINATRGDKKLYEQFKFSGQTVRNPIYEDTQASNLAAALKDFFESKIYGRYLKDSGETLGIDNNKAAGLLLKLGSTVQLGFNALAWVANATTGAAMQNIEAAAGEFFTAKELFKADKEFVKVMGEFIGDIGQRIQTSKLALFDEMFDVRQNYKSKIRNTRFTNKTLITRIFGPGMQYIGQDAGDHWLYNRSAIAMALKYKLKDSRGNEISLWDALIKVPVNKDKPELGYKLTIKEGVTKLDGSSFSGRDISDISGRMRYINQHTFGVYNDEDAIAARRVILGRFIMQYRDWIPAQFRYRFGGKTTNLEKGGIVEGYYRTFYRFGKQIYEELKNGEKTIAQVWDSLDDYEKANIVRVRTEFVQWLAVWALASILRSDDKDRPWLIRMLSYLASREKTELGALTPIMTIPEMIKIIKSPVANTSVISDVYNLRLLLNPMNYTDEIKSGDYKGHSTAYRAFMRSPLTLWYRTVKRTVNPEKAAQFYETE